VKSAIQINVNSHTLKDEASVLGCS